MSMRSLHIHPPPGTVLQAYATPGPPGAGVTHYLMYDSTDEGKVREWLTTIALNLDTMIAAQVAHPVKTPQVGNSNVCVICQKPGHSAVPHPDNPNWSVCPVAAEQKPDEKTEEKTSDNNLQETVRQNSETANNAPTIVPNG